VRWKAINNNNNNNNNNKSRSRTDHEEGGGVSRYSSMRSLTSALRGTGWSTPRPGRFTPWKGAPIQEAE